MLTSLLLLTALALPAAEPIGNRKQLFIDHKFIESSEGVTLVMNPARRTGEIVIQSDAPWEKDLRPASYSTVLKENGKVRMWYQLSGLQQEKGKNPDFMGVAYAESSDGIHFVKKPLGLVEVNGSKANNFVMPTDPKLLSMGGGSVQRDENPNCPPGERYKSWQKIYPKPGTGIKGPHRVWVSPDGIHWKLDERLVTGLRAADTQPTWFWDPRTGKYTGYSREWIGEGNGRRVRMASYNESPDMFRWSNTQIVMEPDALDFTGFARAMIDPEKMKIKGEVLEPESKEPYPDQVPPPGAPVDIYGPGVVLYEGIYLGLMTMFHHFDISKPHAWPNTSDVQLALSRDGRHFQRPGGRMPFLGLGPSGSFDSKWIWPMPRPIEMGDELWIYYFGTNRDHGHDVDAAAPAMQAAISRAVLRKDGFVSAEFQYAGGMLLTPPVVFEGSRLELNLDTGAGGVGKVELLDEAGAPIPGYTMAEADALNINSVRAAVSWQGRTDVSKLAGKPVRLHLRMRAAKLYAFQFR